MVSGVLRYDAELGCFQLEADGLAYPVVWPAGTEGVAEGPGVELPDGLVVLVGQSVSGGGGYHQADDDYLAAIDIPPGCLPQTGEVAVYNVNDPLHTP